MTELTEQRLQRHASRKIPWRQKLTRSAVATVLYIAPDGNTEVLLMQRPSKDGDPWSGDVCYPGGRMQADDRNALDTACREMLEEVGIDIRKAGRLVGRLSDVITREHGRKRPMIVTPYVFVVEQKPATLVTEEAETSFWCPLSFFADHNNRERMTWRLGGKTVGVPLSMPVYYFDNEQTTRRIWGLTLSMLDELTQVVIGKGNNHYRAD